MMHYFMLKSTQFHHSSGRWKQVYQSPHLGTCNSTFMGNAMKMPTTFLSSSLVQMEIVLFQCRIEPSTEAPLVTRFNYLLQVFHLILHWEGFPPTGRGRGSGCFDGTFTVISTRFLSLLDSRGEYLGFCGHS